MTPKQQGVLVVSAPTTVSYSRNPAAQVKQRFITEGSACASLLSLSLFMSVVLMGFLIAVLSVNTSFETLVFC